MTTAPRRVLVVNHWHDDNRGDSAISQSILQLLRQVEPDADVVLAGLTEAGPEWERSVRLVCRAFTDAHAIPSPIPTELRGDLRRSRPSWITTADAARWLIRLLPIGVGVATGRPPRRLRRLVASADVVVAVGGSNIYDDPSVSPALSLARLLAVGSPVHAATRARKRVVLLGHTLGPFPRGAGRRLARRLVRGVDLAVVRDAGSVAHAEHLGVRHVEVAPDMAFAVAPERSPLAARVIAALPHPPSRCLGISMRQHPSLGPTADARALAEIAEAARRMVAAGVVDAVVVVPHTVGPTPIEDDREISRQLVDELADIPVIMVDNDLTPSELACFYGSLAAVVAVRLHAAILSLAAGTPVYAIGYFTAKTQGVMASVGLPDAVGDFATVTADDIVAAITRLISPATRAMLIAGSDQRRSELAERAVGWFAPARSESTEAVAP